MAKCESCGKGTTFGHNRSFSLRATNRTFKPNLQKNYDRRKWAKSTKDALCKMHSYFGKAQLSTAFSDTINKDTASAVFLFNEGIS